VTDWTRRWRPGDEAADDYEIRWEALAAAGHDVHGEASLIQRLGARSVLDAGCGTGRVARELVARGLEVVGVDIDPGMLATARRKAPDLDWHLGDLASVDLGRTFDAVLLAGNVMLFLAPGTEGAVVANLARHLSAGGLLIAGFQLAPGYLELSDYDAHATAAGLTLAERWSTWDQDPWDSLDNYAVSVHRKPAAEASSRSRA
jgi:SAM-dependent methyltransferase